jgi:hypothetical protein
MSWDFATNNSLANLHHGIMVDNALSQAERQYASQHVQMDLGNPSLQTPLSGMLPKLGGGFLGYQVGKFMDMSMPGKVVSTAAGYGVGKMVHDFYQGYNKAMGPDNSWKMQSFSG